MIPEVLLVEIKVKAIFKKDVISEADIAKTRLLINRWKILTDYKNNNSK